MDYQLSKGKTIVLAVTIATAYTVWGLLLSLQPSFYPAEAEKKGATPKQYGFVFGISYLAGFLVAPIFGRWGAAIGPKILYNTGAFVQSICGIAFSFLMYIDGANMFIGLSYFLRALGGIADVAAWGAVVSILMKVFPSKITTVMSWTEMFFGLGSMMGPALGSSLYSIGGFQLPFLVVGSIAFIVAFGLLIVIPNVKQDPVRQVYHKSLSFQDIIKSVSILLPFLDLLVCFFGYGMTISMLEPHLIEAGASITDVGLTFLIFGGCYMVSSPVCGILCDRVPYLTLISIIGNLLLSLAFIFIGPLPGLQMEPTWKSITVACAFAAAGFGSIMVSTFGRAQITAQRKGFPKDIDTYIMISGMWTSSLYLGSFLGPTIAGFLVDAYGFRASSMVFFAGFVIVLMVDFVDLAYNVKLNSRVKLSEYEQLP